MEKQEVLEAVKSSYSISEASRVIFGYENSRTFNKVKELIIQYNADISHFGRISCRKYKRIIKTCPICEKTFEEREGHPREKSTCSHGCANTYFRSGSNHGNWKGENSKAYGYRRICFKHHKKECIFCGETLIVEVHHNDGNNKNNKPENLIPLCPTHHKYFHSKYRVLVVPKIKEYLKNWKYNNKVWGQCRGCTCWLWKPEIPWVRFPPRPIKTMTYRL